MPSTVNGIGTHYYGEKNAVQYHGICHHCKHYIQLKSYDTGLYFVLVFIPIIPLGKKRIVDFCARCGTHRVLALKDFQHLRAVADAAHEKLKSNPCETTTVQALKAAIQCWDQPLVYDVCQTVEAALPNDPESLRLAAAYYSEFLYKPADAERLLRLALACKDEPQTRELLAQSLLAQEKPMEAEPYLRHIVEEGISDRVGLIYWLAQSFQAKGEHILALAYFEHCLALAPAMAENKEFKLLKATSEKNINSQEKIEPSKIIASAHSSVRNKRWAIAISAIVAVALAGYVIYAIYLGRNHPVYLVNGLNQPSTFLINGQTHTLTPLQLSKISLPEGSVTIQMVDPKPIEPPQTSKIETSLWLRPLGWTTFIINPDRTAVISRITYHYAAANARPPHYTLQSGNTVLTFPSVDYDFESPPSTIKTTSKSGDSKTALERWENHIQSTNEWIVLMSAEKYLGNPETIQLARRRLFINPENDACLGYLYSHQTPAEFTKTVAPLLDLRPINMSLHRVYQDAMDSLNDEARLQATYDAFLQKEPANTDLVYLKTRIDRDRLKAKQTLQELVQSGKGSVYMQRSLTYINAAQGDIDAASLNAQNVLRAQDDNQSRLAMTDLFLPLLIASGKLNQAGDAIQPLLAEPAMLSVPAYTIAVQIAMAKNDIRRADELIAELDAKGGRVDYIDKSTAPQVKNATITYPRGDMALFARELENSSDHELHFQRLIALNQLEDAHKHLTDQADKTTPEECLVLYIADMQASKNKLAQDALDMAVRSLAQKGYTQRLWSTALSGKQTPDFQQLRHMPDSFAQWPTYLTALGLARPEYQPQAFPLARVLLILRTFPYHTLAPALGITPRKS